jgi:hypothetical protein
VFSRVDFFGFFVFEECRLLSTIILPFLQQQQQQQRQHQHQDNKTNKQTNKHLASTRASPVQTALLLSHTNYKKSSSLLKSLVLPYSLRVSEKSCTSVYNNPFHSIPFHNTQHKTKRNPQNESNTEHIRIFLHTWYSHCHVRDDVFGVYEQQFYW